MRVDVLDRADHLRPSDENSPPHGSDVDGRALLCKRYGSGTVAELIQSSGLIAPAAGLTPELSARRLRLLLLGLGFATGMEFYTADSVNLVLTDLTGSFGVSGDEASWSLTVYASALFLGVPVCVWLAGHIGYKNYLIGSVLLFVAGSVVSATSLSFDTMLVARAFQG